MFVTVVTQRPWRFRGEDALDCARIASPFRYVHGYADR